MQQLEVFRGGDDDDDDGGEEREGGRVMVTPTPGTLGQSDGGGDMGDGGGFT